MGLPRFVRSTDAALPGKDRQARQIFFFPTCIMQVKKPNLVTPTPRLKRTASGLPHRSLAMPCGGCVSCHLPDALVTACASHGTGKRRHHGLRVRT